MPGKTKNFALCIATGIEATFATQWAEWVHAGEIANPSRIAHSNINDAYETMTELLAADERVKDIWVYGHGDGSGYFFARPTRDAKDAEVFDLPTARAFVGKNAPASRFRMFCVEGLTHAHMYSCNAGIAKDALAAARLLFSGGVGAVCGPTMWLNYIMRSLSLRKAAAAKAPACAPVFFNSAPTSPKALAQSIADFDDVIDRDPRCYPKSFAKTLKANMDAFAQKFYFDNLSKWFSMLAKGDRVPHAARGAAGKSGAAQAAMWRMMAIPWPTPDTGPLFATLATPFLATTLFDFDSLHAIGFPGVRADGSNVFPDSPGWKKAFVSVPPGLTC